jgi:hypothetical protein
MGSLGIAEVVILFPITLVALTIPLLLVFALVKLRQFGKRLDALEARVNTLNKT